MSDIKVGDLVVVVRTCCENTAKESLGMIGQVEYFEYPKLIQCTYCKKENNTPQVAIDFPSRFNAAPLSWLRRIPPLSELESTEHKEEIQA